MCDLNLSPKPKIRGKILDGELRGFASYVTYIRNVRMTWEHPRKGGKAPPI